MPFPTIIPSITFANSPKYQGQVNTPVGSSTTSTLGTTSTTPTIEATLSDEPTSGSTTGGGATSGGTSVILEPTIVSPILNNVEQPILDESKPSVVSETVKNVLATLPPFLGGGGGGGGGASATEPTVGATEKKPNYVLYVGVLLAVLVAYKVLSKNKS